jgi:hypothetical protein
MPSAGPHSINADIIDGAFVMCGGGGGPEMIWSRTITCSGRKSKEQLTRLEQP